MFQEKLILCHAVIWLLARDPISIVTILLLLGGKRNSDKLIALGTRNSNHVDVDSKFGSSVTHIVLCPSATRTYGGLCCIKCKIYALLNPEKIMVILPTYKHVHVGAVTAVFG